LAINVVRPSAVIRKRVEENNNQYALIDPDVGSSPHVAKIECNGQSDGALSGFFLEIRKSFRRGCGPDDWPAGSDRYCADGELAAILFDQQFGQPPCFGICIEPSTGKFGGAESPPFRFKQ